MGKCNYIPQFSSASLCERLCISAVRVSTCELWYIPFRSPSLFISRLGACLCRTLYYTILFTGSGPYTCTQKAKNSNFHKEKQYRSHNTQNRQGNVKKRKNNKKVNNNMNVVIKLSQYYILVTNLLVTSWKINVPFIVLSACKTYHNVTWCFSDRVS
jgi:hypothetical protein